MKTTFQTAIRGFGNNTGIEVPAENMAELGAGKRPPVVVTVGGYTYQSTVAVMNGLNLISLPKAHREAAGLAAGDRVDVMLVVDSGPRTVEVLAEAKADETRQRRITKVLDVLT